MPSPKFIPVEGMPGWSRAGISGDLPRIEDLARSLNANRPPHTYFVCGLLPDDAQVLLYRIQGSNPLDIVRVFQVGAHAESSYGEDAQSAVLAQLALVHAQNPLVPFFADSAGLKCAFERPIESVFAEFLDSTITEGIEIYADEGCIGPVVMTEGYLHLWWD